jgi:hypothetical protein
LQCPACLSRSHDIDSSLHREQSANLGHKVGAGSNLWDSFAGTRFTDILDVMHDTGFIGLRLTQYPQILTKYEIPPEQMERELFKCGLHVDRP